LDFYLGPPYQFFQEIFVLAPVILFAILLLFIFNYKFTGIFRIFWNRLAEQLFGYQTRPKT
jgi:hypothetical protein